MLTFRSLLRLCATGTALVCCVQAQALSPQQEQDIQRLVDKVAASRCVFVRNGTDHSAPDAAQHLRRKLDATRSRIQSTRDFIDAVASKSSMTGQPYQVRCPGKPAQSAQSWLHQLHHP